MREMKDSGIEWIGTIPKNWKLLRIQYGLYEIKENNTLKKTSQVLSLVKDNGVMLYEEKGNKGNKSKEDISQYKIAYPNTLIVNSMNILIGSVGISKYTGCVSPVYYVFKETEQTDLRYINYIFNTREFQKELRKYANGILEIRLRVSANDIFKRKIPFPNKQTQKLIADFLDQKCSEIDALTADIQTQIETLEEYKKSVITEAVTKGLDPNVEMKDSGIEWIGKIPADWNVTKIKYLFSSGKGLSITKADLEDNGLPVISYGQIHSKENTNTDIKDSLIRFVDNKYEVFKQCKVNQYDFVFADTSEDYDGCGNCCYKRDNSTLYAGYHSIVLHSFKEKDNRFLAYLFKTDSWRKQLRETASGVKVFSITQKKLINTSVILPPENQRIIIADFLDKKCSEIDLTISEKQQQLETLAEYKKSLIYEYVTGKKEVA